MHAGACSRAIPGGAAGGKRRRQLEEAFIGYLEQAAAECWSHAPAGERGGRARQIMKRCNNGHAARRRFSLQPPVGYAYRESLELLRSDPAGICADRLGC